jgi:hypothetical protein
MTIKADKWPPKLSADRAFDIAHKINAAYGKKVNRTLLTDILDSTLKSSNFGKRLIALQTFGLISVDKEIVQLTDLALRLVAPISKEEQDDAKLKAFDFHPILRDFRERYPGGHLPEEDSLRNLLVREYLVPLESVEEWIDFVTSSFRAISSIFPRAQPTSPIGITSEENVAMPFVAVKSQSATIPILNSHTLPLPNGRSITFPLDITDEEVDHFTKYVQSWKALSAKK